MNDDPSSCTESAESEPPQRRPSAPLCVDVIEDGGDWSCIARVSEVVEAAALAAAREPLSRLAGASAAIALSDDRAVAALNGSYRGKAAPTNVLSFPAAESPVFGKAGGERFLGDVILAAETVMREAAETGVPAGHHLQHLVVHGLLHLSGFDHETDEAAAEMETLETRILATLGIPDPYTEPLAEFET